MSSLHHQASGLNGGLGRCREVLVHSPQRRRPKVRAEGGLALGRISSSLAIGCAMALAIVLMNRRSRHRAA
jgi:hypothetical protein